MKRRRSTNQDSRTRAFSVKLGTLDSSSNISVAGSGILGLLSVIRDVCTVYGAEEHVRYPGTISGF